MLLCAHACLCFRVDFVVQFVTIVWQCPSKIQFSLLGNLAVKNVIMQCLQHTIQL